MFCAYCLVIYASHFFALTAFSNFCSQKNDVRLLEKVMRSLEKVMRLLGKVVRSSEKVMRLLGKVMRSLEKVMRSSEKTLQFIARRCFEVRWKQIVSEKQAKSVSAIRHIWEFLKCFFLKMVAKCVHKIPEYGVFSEKAAI